MKITKKEESTLWAEIDALYQIDERPLDSFTAKEKSIEWGCAWCTARDRLNKLVKEGKLQTAQLRIPARDGRVREQWVYWAS